MSDNVRTAGPWWFDGDWHRLPTIFGADRKTRIAIVEKSGMARDARTPAQEANARLLAAAPELLAAATYAVQQLADGDDPELDDDGEEIDPFERLRAAIAKAEGRS